MLQLFLQQISEREEKIMGKYGSGVSMKDVIRMEVEDARSALEHEQVDEDVISYVLDILTNMAYNWCESNAAARAVELWVKDNLSEEQYKDYLTCLIQPEYYEERATVFEETFPEEFSIVDQDRDEE